MALRVTFAWPAGFARVPDEPWTRAAVSELAEKYDSVERHGWYANLDPTVRDLVDGLREGDVLVDYSGGTGILLGRLLEAAGPFPFGAIDVDASPKFLRLALEKLGAEPRVAFRLLEWRKEAKALAPLDEALGPAMATRGVDAVVSANAMHLYPDLEPTFRAWRRCLRPSGRALAQSGNVRVPEADGWIIDDTVAAVAQEARRIVEEDERFARHRDALRDPARLAQHDAFRRRVFVPPRALSTYVEAFETSGFRVEDVRTRRIRARSDEWLEFLQVYDEAVLGWVGGTEKIEGRAASPADRRDRLDLMALALDRALRGRGTFDATWTYLRCAPQ